MNTYQKVNGVILNMLDQGIIPWKRPYLSPEGINAVSKHKYRGSNRIVTSGVCFLHKFGFNMWGTFLQFKEKGYCIKKGEKGTPVVFYTPWKVTEEKKNRETGELEEKEKTVPVLRYFTVFNIEQSTGFDTLKPKQNGDKTEYRKAEELFMEIVQRHSIKVQTAPKPSYSHFLDTVTIPPRESFNSNGEYWSTVFHELIHWTGASNRLNRPPHEKGSEAYGWEELTAEIGNAYLCGLCGVVPCELGSNDEIVENIAAYINSWKQQIQKNQRWFVTAANKAEKAVNYLLGIVPS